MRAKRILVIGLGAALLAPVLPLGGTVASAGVTATCFGSPGPGETRNVIIGTNQSETLEGTPGPDLIIGRRGADTIFGFGGNDLICGGEDTPAADGGDVIYAGGGQDIMFGNEGDDRIFGGSDRDNMFGNEGGDLLNGGPNEPGVGDEANFWFAQKPVVGNLETGRARGEGRDTLRNLEGIGGSQYDDLLIGDNTDNSFDGGIAPSGDDVMRGRGGVDTLSLTFTNNNMFVNLQGGTSFGDGNDTVNSFEHVIGSNQNDYITGTRGPNALFGSSGHDTLYGRAGDDIMLGFSGFDTMFGGVGSADFVSYSDGNVDPNLPDPSVDVNLMTGNVQRDDGNDTLDGVEMIEGSSANDQITGDNGPNFFYADEGADNINGEGGSDLIFFLGAGPGGVNVDLTNGSALGMGIDQLSQIEHVVGSNFGDQLIGNGARNFLNGSTGTDEVLGLGANDYLAGGAGDDTVDGGAGERDMIDFFQSNAGILLNLGTGTASGEGTDTLLDVEAASGSGKADTFRGNADPNFFYGQGGSDYLLGRGGPDHLDGGKNSDALNGGPAIDECFKKDESSGCEKFSRPKGHPLSAVSRRYKKAVAAARRYKRRYK